MVLEPRAFWASEPPEPRSRLSNWPTLLFSWWCTIFAAVIIVTRLWGRKTRSNKLFREDYIMTAALVPLFVRMLLIHFVLIYGTNNINTAHRELTPLQLRAHAVGAQLVLPARIFYALFIWTSKFTVSEFLKRITLRIWRKSHQRTLQGIRAFLVVTFVAVVIATVAECQPFHHYWQVVPDPGPHCRQGFAQLLVMGGCDMVTDILLIAFPIPVVLTSGVSWKRKLQMVLLFSLSAIMIGVTAARIPEVIAKHGRQQYRTVWASCEILAASAVSNAVILGSMLRDKGTKKNKFKSHSMTESIDRTSARRPAPVRYAAAESDEDLFIELGCRVPEHLRKESAAAAAAPRPAPPALPANATATAMAAPKPTVPPSRVSPCLSGTLFDVGHLLEEQQQQRSGVSPPRGRRAAGGQMAPTASLGGVSAHDFAWGAGGERAARGGARAFLRDVGGILSPSLVRNSSGSPRGDRETSRGSRRRRAATAGVRGPMIERQETHMSLQDPGGLLSHTHETAHASGADAPGAGHGIDT